MSIAKGPDISPATGQNPLAVVLTNRSARACVLSGYPTAAFLAVNGDVLPFSISHRGDQMVTSRPPVDVRVPPGRSVFFMVNKYRCDLGVLRAATSVRIGLPGAALPTFRIAIAHQPVNGYCGKGDPGSIVTVSPIEPSLAAAGRRP